MGDLKTIKDNVSDQLTDLGLNVKYIVIDPITRIDPTIKILEKMLPEGQRISAIPNPRLVMRLDQYDYCEFMGNITYHDDIIGLSHGIYIDIHGSCRGGELVPVNGIPIIYHNRVEVYFRDWTGIVYEKYKAVITLCDSIGKPLPEESGYTPNFKNALDEAMKWYLDGCEGIRFVA